MFRKFFPLLAISFLASQDVAGSYQLTGLYIIHQSIARDDTPIMVTNSALGLSMEIGKIEEGEIYKTTYQGPRGHRYAQALGVILNVTFRLDGTATVEEGSYYPSEDLIEGTCVPDIEVLPITDQMIYFSDLQAGRTIPYANIVGSSPNGVHDHVSDGFIAGSSHIYAGVTAGSIGLAQTGFLDHFPNSPVYPTLCDNDNNCFKVIKQDGDPVNPGQLLPGTTGGYVIKDPPFSIATTSGDENDCADFYVEWHAIDGAISGSGLGDIIGQDEDGDGTDFDRIWGTTSLTVTHLPPTCTGYPGQFNKQIFGDVRDDFPGCADYLSQDTEGYVWDPSSYSVWGNFLTYNAIKYLQTGLEQYLFDDSDHDYPSGGNGRLVMDFDGMCVKDINVRHTMLEFNEVGPGGCINWGDCASSAGDLTNDGNVDILDMEDLTTCILAHNCYVSPGSSSTTFNGPTMWGCAGDMNSDGIYNIIDILSIAYCILDGTCSGRMDDATEAKLMIQDQRLIYEADGLLGGVELTLRHGIDFSIQPTNSALFSNHITEGNETRVIIITPETNELFTFAGDFEIVDVIAANSHEEIAYILPGKFGLSDAYPNPFNPTTSMEIILTVSGNMQVDVYSLAGKLVESLASGYHNADTYLLNWDATNVPSGIYFIQAESGGMISTQKVMLVK